MPELFHVETSKPKGVAPTPVTSSESTGVPKLLSAFMVKPDGVRFETQAAQEEILLFLRAHPVTNVGWILATVILLLLPGFVMPFLMRSGMFSQGIPAGYFVVFPYLWYLGTVGFAFTNFLKWYFNVYIVTNERVVDIDWISLLYKQLSSTQLNKIQDVTYKQSGILDSFFDFGNVMIQTAGESPNFEFEAVPNPERVLREINEIIGIKEGKEVSP